MVTVRFSCGHVAPVDPAAVPGHPACPVCAVGVVSQVYVSRPVFTGTVKEGPR